MKKLPSVRASLPCKKCFSEILMAMKTKETNVKMRKSVSSVLPILDISKIAMYEY